MRQMSSGCFVHQHRRAGVPRRVEPGAAFGRMAAVQLDVDDHVAAFVAGADQLEAKRLAHEALAAIAGREPLAAQRMVAERVAHRQPQSIGFLLDPGQRAAPPDVDQARHRGVAALDLVQQVLFDVVLLEIDHRRQLLQLVVRHLEAGTPLRSCRSCVRRSRAGPSPGRPAARPGAAMISRLRREMQAARLPTQTVSSASSDHAAHPVVREPERERHADRAAAGDHHRMHAGVDAPPPAAAAKARSARGGRRRPRAAVRRPPAGSGRWRRRRRGRREGIAAAVFMEGDCPDAAARPLS